MKTQITLILFSIAALFACNLNVNESFIPGIYVHNAKGSYSVASDTLLIQKAEGNRFDIERRTGFNLVRDGIKGKREHETEQWNAILDEKTGLLTETQKGKTLVFYPDSNMLVIGTRRYKKVN